MVKQNENNNKKGEKFSTDKTTNTKQQHKLAENNDSRKYICLYCNNKKDFYDKSSLNRHYRRKHKEKLEKCKFCSKEFYSLSLHEKKCIFKHKKKFEEISPKNNPDKNEAVAKNYLLEIKENNELSNNAKTVNNNNINNMNLNNTHKKDNSLKIIKGFETQILGAIKDNNKNKINDDKNNISYEVKEKYNLTPMSTEEILNLLNISNIYNVHQNFFMLSNMIIGAGTYGTVYLGVKIYPLELVAIKSQIKKNINYEILSSEIKIIKKLSDTKIIPKIFQDFSGQQNYYIIQKLEGPSLAKYIQYCKTFDLITILNISIELLTVLKIIHNHGIIHNDLKEDNIITLLKPELIENKIIHFTIIDFGLSYQCLDEKGHYIKTNYKIKGNYYYASKNALSGGFISRSDDIISLCYLMLKLVGNDLPWDKIKYNIKAINPDKDYKNKVLKVKEDSINYNFINEKFQVFKKILEDVEKNNFETIPNYDKYEQWLYDELIKLKKDDRNYNFNWEKLFRDKYKNIDNIEKEYENDEKIQSIFAGYPKQMIKYILK